MPFNINNPIREVPLFSHFLAEETKTWVEVCARCYEAQMKNFLFKELQEDFTEEESFFHLLIHSFIHPPSIL